MYWGLLLVSGVAFSCSTEFIPEINEKLRMVPFTTEFKVIMTTIMIADFAGCYLIEMVLKHAFSDFRPKDIAVRRSDQIQAEEARVAKEAAAVAAAAAAAEKEGGEEKEAKGDEKKGFKT